MGTSSPNSSIAFTDGFGGGGGVILGPQTNQFVSTSSRTDAVSKLTTYASANPSWLAQYDSHSMDQTANQPFAVSIVYPSGTASSGELLARSNSNWVSVGSAVVGQQGPQGLPGSAANLAAVPIGHIPIKGSDGVNFYDSGISQMPNGEYEYANGMILPRNSLQVGYSGIQSGFGSIIKFKSLYTGLTGLYPFQYYDPTTGSTRIQEVSFGPQINTVINATDNQFAPLSGSFTVPTTQFSVLFNLIFKTGTSTTANNVRFSCTAAGQTDPFFYYPTKQAWLTGQNGADISSDANGLVSVDITDAPIVIPLASTVTVNYAIQSIANGDPGPKGSTTTPYLAVNRSPITLQSIARLNEIPDAVFDWVRISGNVTIDTNNIDTYRNKGIITTNAVTGRLDLNLGGRIWQDGDELWIKNSYNGAQFSPYILVNAGTGVTINDEIDYSIEADHGLLIKYDAVAYKWMLFSEYLGSPAIRSIGNTNVTLNYTNTDGFQSSLTLSPAIDATLSGAGTVASPLKIAQQSATTGQGLVWNGTTWAPGSEYLFGRTLNATTPTGTQVIKFDATNNRWTPDIERIGQWGYSGAVPTSGQSLVYDSVNQWWFPSNPYLDGNYVNGQNPQTGDRLAFNGTQWAPSRNGGSVFSRRHSTTQSVANLTDTRVAFDTGDSNKAFNSGNVGITYDGTTNIGRFTNTSGRRLVLSVSYQVIWDANATGIRFTWIRYNGTAGDRLAYLGIGASPSDVTVNSTSAIICLDNNEFFEVWCYQGSGSTINIGGSAGGVNAGFGNRIQIARIND